MEVFPIFIIVMVLIAVSGALILLRPSANQDEPRLQSLSSSSMTFNNVKKMILFFDTETTGLPRDYNAPVWDDKNWPRLVQLSWIVANEQGFEVRKSSRIIKPEGYMIPKGSSAIHGITTERAKEEGEDLITVLKIFVSEYDRADIVVGHNVDFDINVIDAELCRKSMGTLSYKPTYCTKEIGTPVCKIPKGYEDGYKWPTLQELYRHLFGRDFFGAHDAASDVEATKQCFFELKECGYIRLR